MSSPYFWLAVAVFTAIGCARVWRDQRRRKGAMARSREARAELPSPAPTGSDAPGEFVAGAFTSRWGRFKAERRRSGRRPRSRT